MAKALKTVAACKVEIALLNQKLTAKTNEVHRLEQKVGRAGDRETELKEQLQQSNRDLSYYVEMCSRASVENRLLRDALNTVQLMARAVEHANSEAKRMRYEADVNSAAATPPEKDNGPNPDYRP